MVWKGAFETGLGFMTLAGIWENQTFWQQFQFHNRWYLRHEYSTMRLVWSQIDGI